MARLAMNVSDFIFSILQEIQSFCSIVINHPLFPVPANPVLPSQYPLSEDNLLLGVIPLIPFHKHVDFFKEIAHDVADPSSMLARQQVRWGRVRDLIRRMADSNVRHHHRGWIPFYSLFNLLPAH